MTRPRKIPTAQAGIEPRIFRSRGGRLNHQANKAVSLPVGHRVGVNVWLMRFMLILLLPSIFSVEKDTCVAGFMPPASTSSHSYLHTHCAMSADYVFRFCNCFLMRTFRRMLSVVTSHRPCGAAETSALDIIPERFGQSLSYPVCLYAPHTSIILCHIQWLRPWLGESKKFCARYLPKLSMDSDGNGHAVDTCWSDDP